MRPLLVVLGSAALLLPGAPAAAEIHDPIADIPVQAGAPWPQMRRDRRNTARSPIVGRYAGAKPWSVQLGKGIFNTAVIDRAQTAYVGSAAGKLFAIDRKGRTRFTFQTGGLLDAGGVLTDGGDGKKGSLVFGSGDETLYRIRLTRKRMTQAQRTIWTFKSPTKPATGQLLNYWEGPLGLSPNGDILAGNTGGGAHVVKPDGTLRSVYQAGNSVWTQAATGDDGTTFWGSVDRTFFALKRDGSLKWSQPTLGFVTASPALGTDGTVYTASFDGKVYALDPETGLTRWSVQTRDHVYGGPALAQDAAGQTSLIVVGSADGALYGIRPDGSVQWRYETGDPIRSSPAIGVAPDGGQIAYVGSSNGRLYAIDVATGKRRWSFDTTPTDPVLRDRNDLNGSPALDADGVVIGGEHGSVWRIPYDYCLTAKDARCSVAPGGDLPPELNRVLFTTPGGTTQLGAAPLELAPATTIAGRLVVRQADETVDAGAVAIPDASGLVTADPPFPHTTQTSGDGAFLFVQPDGFLKPSTDYALRFAGTQQSGGLVVGNTTVGGTKTAPFDDTIRFRTAPVRPGPRFALRRDRVSALEITRLAVPEPSLLPSVNQIGFDQYDLIAGAVSIGDRDAEGALPIVLWVVGGKRDAQGRLVADPRAGFAFPLEGRLLGDQFILRRDGLTLQFSFGDVPVRRFELRGSLTPKSDSRPGSALYAEVTCNEVPNYGPTLNVTGICNTGGTLVVGGTFLTHRYPPKGGASSRPAGVTLGKLTLKRPTAGADGALDAELDLAPGARYPAVDHLGSLLLLDPATGKPLALDYKKLTDNTAAGAEHDLRRIHLTLPAGSALPDRVRALVLTDAFPLAGRDL